MLTLNDGRAELWQWDTGRTLTVDAECSQVHFSNKVFGRSIDVDVVDRVATIPDILLQTDKDLNVWAFVGTAENGYTKISKTFKVNRRNKPADYVFTPSEQTTIAELLERIHDDLQEATNEALAQAKASGEFDGADGKSAYQYAKDGGYTGTETEFAEKMAAPLPGVDDTLTRIGQAADAAKVGEELRSLSEENVKSAELDEYNMVSFKNANGVVLFTLDLSGISVGTYGDIVLSLDALALTEGGTGTFAVNLSTAPSRDQVVYLAVSDATRLSVTPLAITFTAANYNIPQTVTVVSEQDEDYDDNEALITITSQKYSKQIVVTITDDDELYLPFGGKEVVSFIRQSTYATTDDGCTYYDEANDETITQAGNHKNIWPFKTGLTGANLQGTPTKARGLLEANTTGAYSLIEVWNGIAIPNKANHRSGMNGINMNAISNAFLNNSWESIAIKLEGMKYRNTAGELATQTLAETASDVLKNELPFTTAGWTKGVTATVFTATGEVVFYGGNVEVYRIAAPADFVSWDWDLSARSWTDLLYDKSEPRDSIIIVNDAVTPDDITKFYEHEVEANF